MEDLQTEAEAKPRLTPESRLTTRFEQLPILFDLLRWLPIAALVGVMAGSASAVLLISLEWATQVRNQHLWLIALLPLAGLAVGLLYWYVGSSVEAGNNLILEEIHDPNETIPLRMTPLVLLGTIVTHLFGGSAGREGTAIQTGASLADQLSRPLRLKPHAAPHPAHDGHQRRLRLGLRHAARRRHLRHRGPHHRRRRLRRHRPLPRRRLPRRDGHPRLGRPPHRSTPSRRSRR